MQVMPQIELLIARYQRPLIIVLVVVSVISVAATGYVFFSSINQTTTEEVPKATFETDVQTRAQVVESGLWESGDVLENQPVYLLEDTPNLGLAVRTRAPKGASIDHTLNVRYEAVRNGEVFWSDTRRRHSRQMTATDGVATSRTTLDVPAILEERRRLTEEIANVGAIRIYLQVAVAYATANYNGSQTATSRFHVSDRAYWVARDLGANRVYTVRREVPANTQPDPVSIGSLATIAVMSLVLAQYISSRPDIDVRKAERALHERRYDEWISKGSLPMWVGDDHVQLDTLEDVVDVAIDSQRRVIHDRQRSVYAVMSEGIVFFYSESGGSWEETTWPEMSIETTGSLPSLDRER